MKPQGKQSELKWFQNEINWNQKEIKRKAIKNQKGFKVYQQEPNQRNRSLRASRLEPTWC